MQTSAGFLEKLLLITRSKGAALLLILIAGFVAFLVSVHIIVSNSSDSYAGWLASFDRLFDLTLALSLVGLTLCVGRAICRSIKLEFANAAEEFSFSVFVGTGTIGLAVLFLGLMGLLRPWPILILILVCLGFTIRELPRTYARLALELRSTISTQQGKIVAALFLSTIIVFILRAETPPHAPDESIYHLAVTSQFVRQGAVFPSYDNSLGNFPFLVHMIYAICLIARSDIAAKLFSLFLAVTTSFALYGFSLRFLTRRTGVFALFAFFAAGMVVEVAVTTRIDVSLAGMLFLTTYAMMNYLNSQQLKWLWMSAVLGGFSLGIKPSAGLWLLLVGLMYTIEKLVLNRQAITHTIKSGLVYMLIAAAVASPWYVKNYVWFHNPIYPMLTGEVADFGSWGVRYFDEEDERKLDAHFNAARTEIPEVALQQEQSLTDAINARIERHPMRLWEFFTRPRAYLMGEPLHYPNYLFLLTPLLIFFRPSRQVSWLLGLSLVFIFFVTSTAWIARYLLPAYPSLTVIVAYILVNLGSRLGPKISFGERVPIYLLIAVFASVVAAEAFAISAMNTIGFVSGKISRREFMNVIGSYHPVDFINLQTPADSRIMCLGVQVNYEIHRDHLADETWFQTKWRRLLVRNDSLEKVNEDLKRQGYTHILYSPDLLKFAAWEGLEGTGGMGLISGKSALRSEDSSRGLGPEYLLLRNWTTFTLYRMKFLETVYSDENGYQVFRIK